MSAEIWKDRQRAKAFLDERSVLIPDLPRQLDVILRVLGFHRPEPQRILDVGSGDAIQLATLLEIFPHASGVAVDFSPPMLEQARRRLDAFGRRAMVVEADLLNTAWRDSLAVPFDVVISSFAIHHLPDERKQALYQEIHALLADGGVFLNCEHVASTTRAGEQMFADAMTTHLYQQRQAQGEDVNLEQLRREARERPDPGDNILALVDDQCRWLRALGFRDVDCFWKYFELAIFGGRK